MIDCIVFSTLKAECKYYFFKENNVPIISLLKSLALTSLESERFLLSRISNTVSLLQCQKVIKRCLVTFYALRNAFF